MDSIFPLDNIDPKLKGKDYIIKYARAMYGDWSNMTSKRILAHAAVRYEEIKAYALGVQPVDKYKPLMGVDQASKTTWLNIDWRVRPILSKFRRIALGKLQDTEYNINFTPVDPTSLTETDKKIAEQKAKIFMRQKLAQQSPELAQHPVVAQEHGEPADEEELDMQTNFGYKTELATAAEEVTLCIFQDPKNNIKEHRYGVAEDLYDYGISGFKIWIDDSNKIRFRKVRTEAAIVSYTNKRDFTDIKHAGEIIEVPMSEIAEHFTKEELDKIVALDPTNNGVQVGSNTIFNNGYDQFKVKVLDGEFKTYNTQVKEQRVNKAGNISFGNAKFKYAKSDEKIKITDDDGEKEEPKYLSKIVESVYKFKWIVGSDFAYDYGEKKDQVRKSENACETELSFFFYAPDFHNMYAQGIMEQLLPMADEYQLLVYKIQNLNNRMMPFGWAIDLDAIEDVALGEGGKNLAPADVLDMFFQSQILVYRKKDVGGANSNVKPIEVVQTSFAAEITALYNHMEAIMKQIRDISGLNEMTDGSSAGQDRMPNQLIASAKESTNNSLHGIIHAEKNLLERLACAAFKNLQIVLKRADYSGLINSVGTGAVKVIKASKDLIDREFCIYCEDKPNDQEKQFLMQQLEPNIQAGLLDLSDALIIMDMYSVKKAYQILQYKIKKNKADAQQQSAQLQQQNAQAQIQSAQAAEQAKQSTLQLEWSLKMEYLKEQIKGQLAVQLEKNKSTETSDMIGAHAQMVVKGMDMVDTSNPDHVAALQNLAQQEGQQDPSQDPNQQGQDPSQPDQQAQMQQMLQQQGQQQPQGQPQQ